MDLSSHSGRQPGCFFCRKFSLPVLLQGRITVASENGEEDTTTNTDRAAGTRKVQLLLNKCKKEPAQAGFILKGSEGERVNGRNYQVPITYLLFCIENN